MSKNKSKPGGTTTVKLITTQEVVVESPLLAKFGMPNGSFGTMRTTREFSVDDAVVQSLIGGLKGVDKGTLVALIGKLVGSFIPTPMPAGPFGIGFDIGQTITDAMGKATGAGGMPKSWTMPGSPFPPPPPPPPVPDGPPGPIPIRPDTRRKPS